MVIYTGESKAKNHLARLTLRECLEYAVESNRSMINARLENQGTAAKTKEVRAAVFPQMNASASQTDNLAIPVVILPGEIIGQPGEMIPAELGVVPYEAGISVQVNQVTFNPALFTGIKTARSEKELMKLKGKITGEQLIYDVASVYYDILYSEQPLESISGNLNLQDSLFAKTALRVKKDLAREIDMHRIKVNISDLKVKWERLDTVVEQQKRLFAGVDGDAVRQRFFGGQRSAYGSQLSGMVFNRR
jgi:outer membrane protein TolC